MERVVAYYRVSTKRQQRSGLGLDAQRAAVTRFAEAEGMNIAGEYVEVETGKGADALDRRPQLAAALLAAKKARCSVLVSKLDRLSRDVAFISGLMAHYPHGIASQSFGSRQGGLARQVGLSRPGRRRSHHLDIHLAGVVFLQSSGLCGFSAELASPLCGLRSGSCGSDRLLVSVAATWTRPGALRRL